MSTFGRRSSRKKRAMAVDTTSPKTEMIDPALLDGAVLRLGQTSIRSDVVGGRARATGGLPLRTVALAVAAILVLGTVGAGVGIAVRKKQQQRRDMRTLAAFVTAAREGQRAK